MAYETGGGLEFRFLINMFPSGLLLHLDNRFSSFLLAYR